MPKYNVTGAVHGGLLDLVVRRRLDGGGARLHICEGEDTCIHCDAEMISFPEEEAATLRAIHATHKREREELKASTDKIFAGLDAATKEKP